MTNTVLYMGEEEKGYKMRIAGLEKKINECSNKSFPLCLKPNSGVNYSTYLIVRARNNIGSSV